MLKRHFPELCPHSFSNQFARAKTVDKKKSQNKESGAWQLTKNKLM